MEHLGKRLMPWSIGWVLEAELGYKSWLNLDGAEKLEHAFYWLPSMID